MLVSVLGDALKAEMPQCLRLLADRLLNEITRQHAVTALAAIAQSPLHVDLSSVMPDVMRELAALLRQNNRQLRQAALAALSALAKHYGADRECHAGFGGVIAELPALISDADLHLAHMALDLVAVMIVEQRARKKKKNRNDAWSETLSLSRCAQSTYGKCASTANEKLSKPLLVLLCSSLLQGWVCLFLFSFVCLCARGRRRAGFGSRGRGVARV